MKKKEDPIPRSKEDCLEEVLVKRIDDVENVTDIPGFHDEAAKALSKYLVILDKVSTPRVTSTVKTSWEELTEHEQDAIGEMFSRKQLAFLGLVTTRINDQRRRKRGLGDIFGGMFGGGDNS